LYQRRINNIYMYSTSTVTAKDGKISIVIVAR
jgi:hypothetical protein